MTNIFNAFLGFIVEATDNFNFLQEPGFWFLAGVLAAAFMALRHTLTKTSCDFKQV